VLGSVELGGAPWSAAIHPDGSRLYVTSTEAAPVAVIDTTTLTVTGTLGAASRGGVAVTPEGTRAYAGAAAGVLVIERAMHFQTSRDRYAPGG
jgi:YVTN family beta-propeller protein